MRTRILGILAALESIVASHVLRLRIVFAAARTHEALLFANDHWYEGGRVDSRLGVRGVQVVVQVVGDKLLLLGLQLRLLLVLLRLMLLRNDLDQLFERYLLDGRCRGVGRLEAVMLQHWQHSLMRAAVVGGQGGAGGIVRLRQHVLDFVADVWRFVVVVCGIGAAQHQIRLVDDQQMVVGPGERVGVVVAVGLLLVVADDQFVVQRVAAFHVDGTVGVLFVVVI